MKIDYCTCSPQTVQQIFASKTHAQGLWFSLNSIFGADGRSFDRDLRPPRRALHSRICFTSFEKKGIGNSRFSEVHEIGISEESSLSGHLFSAIGFPPTQIPLDQSDARWVITSVIHHQRSENFFIENFCVLNLPLSSNPLLPAIKALFSIFQGEFEFFNRRFGLAVFENPQLDVKIHNFFATRWR